MLGFLKGRSQYRQAAELDIKSAARIAPSEADRARRVLPSGEVFTPTQPKTSRRLIGRQAELQQIMQAFLEDHAHVVLYSERGRGKTSLSNMVVESLRAAETVVARYTCEAGSTFDTMMRGLLRSLPSSLLVGHFEHDGVASSGFDGEAAALTDRDSQGCESALPRGILRPQDVTALAHRLSCRRLVGVVDEFDRVIDSDTRTRLADTIKQLSDQNSFLLFLIVGVSENVDQILGQHPSIQRAVQAVHLPLISEQDLAEMVSQGAQGSGIDFPVPIVAHISILARGMPYMAQLIGLRLVQSARARGDIVVRDKDLYEAIVRLIADAPPNAQTLYASLTEYGRNHDMVTALRRIAAAEQDSWGRLRVVDMADGVLISGQLISSANWSKVQAAQILHLDPTEAETFVFAERSLMHYTLQLAARDVVGATIDKQEHADAAMQHPKPYQHELGTGAGSDSLDLKSGVRSGFTRSMSA